MIPINSRFFSPHGVGERADQQLRKGDTHSEQADRQGDIGRWVLKVLGQCRERGQHHIDREHAEQGQGQQQTDRGGFACLRQVFGVSHR